MKRFTLDNGLSCIFIPKPIHTTTINILVKVGSRDETKETHGCAHILEHLLIKQTKKRKNYKKLYIELSRLGNYNAGTSKNTTQYFITTPKEKFEHGLEIFSDLLYNSQLTEKLLSNEKPIILKELNFSKENDTVYSLRLLHRLCFENHPLEHLIIGNENSIKNMKFKDLLKFYKKYYTPSNMHLVVCGKYPKNYKELVNKYFSIKKSNNYKNEIPTQIITQTQQKIKVLKKKQQQAFLTIGFPSVSSYNYKDVVVLLLISNYLGGGLSSRLSMILREKMGLVYSINAECQHYQDTGIFYIQCQVDYKNILNNMGVLSILFKEIKLLKQKGLSSKLLIENKDILITKLTLIQDDPFFLTNYYGNEQLFQQKHITIEDSKKMINSIKLSDINKMIQKLFNFTKMNLCVIGNLSEKKLKTFLSNYYFE